MAESTNDWEELSKNFQKDFEERLAAPWKKEKETDGIVVYKGSHAKVAAWKGEAVLKGALLDVFKAYYDWAPRKVWDTSVHEDSGTVLDLGHNRTVDYSRTLPAFGGVISARDFVDMREWAYIDGDESKGIWAWGGSVVVPEKPEISGAVRGFNYPCGTVVKPTGDGQCHVTLVWHPNIKGMIPAWTVEGAMAKQMVIILEGFRTYCAEKN